MAEPSGYPGRAPRSVARRDNSLPSGFIILPVEWAHAARVAELPFHHRDPFDRLIIAQALVERMPIVSGDPEFTMYGARIVW